MIKIVDSWNVYDDYVLLTVEKMPKHSYWKYKIDGKIYEPVPVYDAPNCIAIRAKGDFTGKYVEFID